MNVLLILAAGESRRMGQPKALLRADGGRTFLEQLAQRGQAAGLTVLVVLGAHAQLVAAAHPGLAWLKNPRWKSGQLSSVRVGLRAALARSARQVLIQPVDAPRVTAHTLAAVSRALDRFPAVVADHRGVAGHPLGLTAAAARSVLARRAQTLELAVRGLDPEPLEVDDRGVTDNFNTPQAYRKAFRRGPAGV